MLLQKVKESNIKTQYKQIKFTEKTGVKQDDTNYFQKIQFTDFNFNVWIMGHEFPEEGFVSYFIILSVMISFTLLLMIMIN